MRTTTEAPVHKSVFCSEKIIKELYGVRGLK